MYYGQTGTVRPGLAVVYGRKDKAGKEVWQAKFLFF
jgi:hypothetical protein